MAQENQLPSTWWGQFSLAAGQTVQWEIGPLKLAVQRLPNEWQIAYERDETIDLETRDWKQTFIAPAIPELNYASTERYAVGLTNEIFRIRPILADRPIITRPLMPLYVPPEEEAIIFVSSPLWARLEIGDPSKILQDVPISRPSDTWFGPSTIEGELGYASRTHARLNLENLPIRPHRAITQVTIGNKASSPLLVDRLSLPVPYLTLFEAATGSLWTQAVIMVRTRDTGLATFQIENGPPEQAGKAQPISDPRQQPSQGMVIRAFGALFRWSQ